MSRVPADDLPVDPPTCDHCGSPALQWLKCKLVCRSCRQIVKSCADLSAAE